MIARPPLLEWTSLTTYLLLIITDQFGCVLIIFVEAGRAGITISSVEDRLGLVFSSCLAVWQPCQQSDCDPGLGLTLMDRRRVVGCSWAAHRPHCRPAVWRTRAADRCADCADNNDIWLASLSPSSANRVRQREWIFLVILQVCLRGKKGSN